MKQPPWLAIAAALSLMACAAHAADMDEAIKYRRNLMSANGGLMGATNAILQKKVDDKGRLAVYAQALAGLNKHVAALFPNGSNVGDTDALPDVWTKRAEFERRAKEVEVKAAAFARSQTPTAFKDLAEACKSCHKDFRK